MIFQQDQQTQSFIVEFGNSLEAQRAYEALNEQELEKLGKVSLDFMIHSPNLLDLKPLEKVPEPQSLKELVERQKFSPFKEVTNKKPEGKQGDFKKVRSHEERRKTVLSKGSDFLNRKSLKEKQEENPFQSKLMPSKVVLISNLEGNFGSAKELFNLFSTFGNIKKVLFMSNLNKAMIEYHENEGALLCALNINNLKLSNTELRVNYSKFQAIDLEKNKRNPNAIAFNEVFLPSPEEHRYKKDDVKTNLSTKVCVSGT